MLSFWREASEKTAGKVHRTEYFSHGGNLLLCIGRHVLHFHRRGRERDHRPEPGSARVWLDLRARFHDRSWLRHAILPEQSHRTGGRKRVLLQLDLVDAPVQQHFRADRDLLPR